MFTERLERREQARYGLRARVGFRWTGMDGVLHQGRGFTRDISAKGMFIHSDFQPPTRADIQVDVFFLSLTELGSKLQMEAKARVVRVEPAAKGEPGGGFAALNSSYVLRDQVEELGIETI